MVSESWGEREFAGLRCGDGRLKARAARVLEQLAARPAASLPEATGTRADLRAAYNLLAHEDVTPEKLLGAHGEATLLRVLEQPRVLVIQDTTEIDLTKLAGRVPELGPLAGEHSAGLYAHPSYVVTPEGLPLGILQARIWTRDRAAYGRKHDRKRRAAADKESARWAAGLAVADRLARTALRTEVVCVADAEADVYECFAAGSAARFVIRSGQDRALLEETSPPQKLRSRAAQAPPLEVLRWELPRVPGRAARTAEITLRTCRATLRPPSRGAAERPAPVTVNVVRASEEGRAGADAVEWLLLTDLPIDTADEVREVVACYARRWSVEVLFRTLKTGCGVERLQLQSLAGLRTAAALYLIVAWRVLQLTHLGRTTPDAPCTTAFEDDQWQVVWRFVRRTPPPERPPPLGEFLRLLATLGGYQNRRSDPAPGPKHLWIALT